MSIAAGGGAAVPLASLNEGERDSFPTLLSRGDVGPLPGGRGGGWSLEKDYDVQIYTYASPSIHVQCHTIIILSTQNDVFATLQLC